MKTQTQQTQQTQTQTQAQTRALAAASKPAPEAARPARSERKYKEVWLVEDAPNSQRKAFWTRIGVAFENKDGSWNLRLSAVPIGNNTLNIRDPRPAENTDGSDSREGQTEPGRPALQAAA